MVQKRKRWEKRSTGIYRTTYGTRVVMDIAAGRAEEWYDNDTPLDDMKKRRNQMRVELEALHPELRAGTHGHKTFNAAIDKHIKTLTISSWRSRRSELRAFAEHWGDKRIHLLNRDDGKQIVKLWHDAGVTPKTIQNRKRALTAMFHDLYGANAPTPLDDVSLPALTKRRPDYVSPATILAVGAQLQASADAKTYARYLVIATTGCRPAHLKRARPQDVSLPRQTWNMHGVKGGEPIPLPLNGDMCVAWAYFLAADAWGDFDGTAYAKAVRAAGWPAHIRPYNAKHSLGMDLGALGTDQDTIKNHLGHTNVKTTEIYTGVIVEKLRTASAALEGRLPWAETPEIAAILDDALGRKPDVATNLKLVKKLGSE